MCDSFQTLQSKGHPKWKEVELAQPELGRGWYYYPYTFNELRACSVARPGKAAPLVRNCSSMEEKILGLCS